MSSVGIRVPGGGPVPAVRKRGGKSRAMSTPVPESTPSMASIRRFTTVVPIRRGLSDRVVMGGSVVA